MKLPNESALTVGIDTDDNKQIEVIEEYPDAEIMWYPDLHDPKEKFRYIKKIEGVVRSAFEYKQFIKFLRHEVNMTSCSYFQNINNMLYNRMKIEIHHTPFTLYDITAIILDKQLEEGGPADLFTMKDIILKEHFAGRVGLFPVSGTPHELLHNSDRLIVPVQFVYGRVQEFIDMYDDYIQPELHEKLESIKRVSEKYTSAKFDVLKVKHVYLDIKGMEVPDQI